MSPRKSRKKSACFSSTTTSTPARANRKPSIIPAGPPPATQQRVSIDEFGHRCMTPRSAPCASARESSIYAQFANLSENAGRIGAFRASIAMQTRAGGADVLQDQSRRHCQRQLCQVDAVLSGGIRHAHLGQDARPAAPRRSATAMSGSISIRAAPGGRPASIISASRSRIPRPRSSGCARNIRP